MYCIKCGKEIPDGDKMICPDCLEAEKKANTAETPDAKTNNTEETDANPETKAEGEGAATCEPCEEYPFKTPYNTPAEPMANPNMPPFPHNGYANPNPYQGNPYQGNPYQGNPYQGNPYQGNPYQGNPYQGNPYNQPYGRPTPPPPPPMNRPPLAPKAPTSAFGLAGFCLSLISLIYLFLGDTAEVFFIIFLPALITGFIFSIKATKETKLGLRSGRGFAKTGLILSIVALSLITLSLITGILVGLSYYK